MNLSQKIRILVILDLVSSVFSKSRIEKNEELLSQENLRNIFPYLEPQKFLEDGFAENGSTCGTDLNLYYEALQGMEFWALKMLDASSKIPVGILEGNFVDLGMFDECIAIKGNFSTKENKGKHCIYTLDIIFPGNVTIDMHPKLAMCLPSTCDIKTVKSIITKVNQLIHDDGIISQDFNLKLIHATCSKLHFEKWTTGSIIATVVIGQLVTFLLFCTVLGFSQNWLKQNNVDGKIIPILAQFSLFNSSLKILSTKENSGYISAIHGIRALSILWVAYGHEIYFNFITSYVNFREFLDWGTSWKCIYLIMGVFSVDTFLLLSGFLLSYHFLRKMSQGANFHLLEYYFHRYIRLTPAVVSLLIIVIYITPHLGSGPRWESDIVENLSADCENSWWKFLLYVQNYVGEPEERLMCMGHLWYLAVDMQLFWISPIILYPLFKKPRVGLTILAVFFIASVVTPACILAKNNLTFNTMAFNMDENVNSDSMIMIYIVTHCRAGPWIFGILFGYIMFRFTSKPKLKLLILGWTTATSCFVFCTWGFLIILQKNYEHDVLFESILASFSRIIWAAGVSWIIYTCHHGCAGILNKFLSLPIFLPISRLAYCIYLLHYMVQNLRSGSARLPGYFSNLTLFADFLSDIMLCIILSFFFCIIFESPMIVLSKISFRKENEKHMNSKMESTREEIKIV